MPTDRPLALTPTTNSLQAGSFSQEAASGLLQVQIRVQDLVLQRDTVDPDKAVDQVGAQIGVNVLHAESAVAAPVEGPDPPVADYLLVVVVNGGRRRRAPLGRRHQRRQRYQQKQQP